MKKSIFEVIKKNIPAKSTVIAAFSGGPDSVFLLAKLLELKKTYPFNIVLAHFNHKLRGKESDRDEDFSRKTAELFKIKFETASSDIKKYAKFHKLNLEEAAREKRYDFLTKIQKKHLGKAILTAHHLDDNIETFLINFLRGSGIQGLRSMQIKNQNILRPLLYTSKKEILKYLKLKKLKFRMDSSNLDKSFIRNRIRLELTPVIKKIQPKLENTFLYTWENLNELNDFFDNEAEKWIDKNKINESEMNKPDFKNIHPALKKKIIQKLYEKTHGSVAGLSKDLMERLADHISNLKTGKKAPFGKKHMLVLTRNTFKITKYKA